MTLIVIKQIHTSFNIASLTPNLRQKGHKLARGVDAGLVKQIIIGLTKKCISQLNQKFNCFTKHRLLTKINFYFWKYYRGTKLTKVRTFKSLAHSLSLRTIIYSQK